jgi:hypothetical protein
MILTACIILHVAANFAAPVGINRVLRWVTCHFFDIFSIKGCVLCSYLEPGGHEVVIRPWFWILWLFIGPVAGTLSIQWYIFIAVSPLSYLVTCIAF